MIKINRVPWLFLPLALTVVSCGKSSDLNRNANPNVIVADSNTNGIMSGMEISEKSDLSKIGRVLEFDGVRAKIAVPRKDHAKLAAKLLSTFEVDDLEIREEELEDVILKFFGGKRA